MRLEDKFMLTIAPVQNEDECCCYCELTHRGIKIAVGECTLAELCSAFGYNLGPIVHNGILFPAQHTVLDLLSLLNTENSPLDIYLGKLSDGRSYKPYDDFQAILDVYAEEIPYLEYKLSGRDIYWGDLPF